MLGATKEAEEVAEEVCGERGMELEWKEQVVSVAWKPNGQHVA